MAAPLPAPRAEFDEVLASLTQTDLLKSRQEVLSKEADIARRKADVATRVREVYLKQGVTVSDELITEGVNRYFEGRLRFEKPKLGLSVLAAFAWIHRWLVMGFLSLFVGLVILANLLVYYTVTLPEREALAAETRAVQTGFANLAKQVPEQIARTRSAIQELRLKIDASAALDLPALGDAASVALAQLETLEQKLPKAERSAKDEGDAPLAPADLQLAKARVNDLQACSESCLSVSKAVQQLDARYGNLLAADRQLAAIWKQIESIKMPQILLAKCMTERDKALEEIGHLGDASLVKKSIDQLNLNISEARVLEGLPGLLRDTAKTARLLAREELAGRHVLPG